jgi:hypothetical protein
MFDLDKYLESMEIKEVTPDDDFIRRTKRRCIQAQKKARGRTEAMRRVKKGVLIAVPAAAILVIGMILGAVFFGDGMDESAVAYCTVDINPSVCINVNASGTVTGVTGQNDDAASILEGLSLEGASAGEAIGAVIRAAREAGYFAEDQRYVLVGCFAADGTLRDMLPGLQSTLEEEFGNMIDLLMVSGSLDDKQMADELHVSAGLLKLSQLAEGVDVEQGDKVEDLLFEVNYVNEGNYCAPELYVNESEYGLMLSWDEMDFGAMGYTGNVRYTIAAGRTEQEAKSTDATGIGSVAFYSYGEQVLLYELMPTNSIVPAGEGRYFVLYAQYGDTVEMSNIVYAVLPALDEEEPSPTPDATPTAVPEPAATPSPTATPKPDTMVEGRVSGESIILSWEKARAEGFQGYKIVASETNPNPRYPDDGYIEYITDRDTTSFSLYEGMGGLKANTNYYFSVTYLYDGDKVIGNAVQLKVPEKEGKPEPPKPAPGEHAASTIAGSMDGTTVHLSWSGISDPAFNGYKVVHSFSDTTPTYPENSYIEYITNASQTSFDVDVTDLSGYTPGAPCWFSITVLYSDGAKKSGNVIQLTMPEGGAPEPEHAASNISGSIDGNTVHLSWEEISGDSWFQGYKVVYSFSDSTPTYPENGYIYYIQNASETSCSIDDITSRDGYVSGATCYFSITVLYSDDTKKYGNVWSIVAP